MRRFLAVLSVFAVVFTACTKKIYIPVEKVVTVHQIDSVAVHDTTVQYRLQTEYVKTYAKDTISLETAFSQFRAWQDTSMNVLVGEAKNKPSTEINIQWRERIVVRDSIVKQDVPVPYEVVKEVKYVPWYVKLFAWLGFAFVIAIAAFVGFKFFAN